MQILQAAPFEAWEAAKIDMLQERWPDSGYSLALWEAACAQNHTASCHRLESTDTNSWIKEECTSGDIVACTMLGWSQTQTNGILDTQNVDFSKGFAILEEMCTKTPEACITLHTYAKKETKSLYLRKIEEACRQENTAACSFTAQVMLDIDPDSPRAKEILIQGCLEKHPESCTFLGGIYINVQQYSQAASVFDQSCHLHHSIGCRLLGQQYLFSQNTSKAEKSFEKACNGLDLEGCLLLSSMLAHQPKKQIGALQRACKLNHAQSCYRVGKELLSTKSTMSIPYLERACVLNHPQACFELGYSYEQKKSPQRALEEYQKGCVFGYAPACVNGANLGFTTNQKNSAISLYSAGCQLGDAKACSTLGLLYLRGKEMEADFGQAHRLLTIGCAAQIQSACDTLFNEFPSHVAHSCTNTNPNHCYFAAQAQEKFQPEQARVFAQQGCDKGDSLSCVKLGYFWLSGIGGEIDKSKASELFIDACKKNQGSGCFNQALLRLEKDQNTASAAELFTKSCNLQDARGCVQGAKLLSATNSTEAMNLYQKGCSLLDGGSCTMLGNSMLLEYPTQSHKHYEKGCSLGYPEACFNLAVLTYKGQGTDKDILLAQQYMHLACTLGSTAACDKRSK